MRYVVIATLLRGVLPEPEPLDDESSIQVEKADYAYRQEVRNMVRRERDPYLTPSQWAEEEAGRAMYVRRRRFA